MPTGKQESLNGIMEKIYSFDVPKIQNERRVQIQGFIDSAINGDEVKKYIVISATLKKDSQEQGILVYVLTNLRLIKIDLDLQEVQSSSFFLNAIVSIERKLIDGDRAAVEVSFQNGFFGLGYSSSNQEITDFFQEVDKARSQGRNV